MAKIRQESGPKRCFPSVVMAGAKDYISFPAQFVGMAADRSQSD
jgi:hypothetical protein